MQEKDIQEDLGQFLALKFFVDTVFFSLDILRFVKINHKIYFRLQSQTGPH